MLKRTRLQDRVIFNTLAFLLIFSWLSPAQGQVTNTRSEAANNNVYWIERLTKDGKLVLREYKLNSTRTIDVSDLEIWSEKLDKPDPINSIYWDRAPDFRLILLQKGWARLKNDNSARKDFIQAQDEAKSKNIGMWFVKTPPTPIPTPSPVLTLSPTPIPSPTTTPSITPEITVPNPAWDWKELVLTIIKIIIAIIGMLGGLELIKLIMAWRKSYRIPIILLGRPSTGKTWLWSRFVDPDISLQELIKIKRSELSAKHKAEEIKTMGPYKITPEYIDTPGGQPGEQVTKLLEKKKLFQWLYKLFIPSKSVWLIMFSSTPDKNVVKSSDMESKIDNVYIGEQLGHLDLPIGILSAKKTPKPQMVIASIGKFDLFADHAPEDPSSRDAKNKLDALFQAHISRIQKACEDQGVSFEFVYSSAATGLGFDKIDRYIHRALFHRRGKRR